MNLKGLPIFVVDLITISWGVNNVEPETDTIFGNDYGGNVKHVAQ